MNSWLGLGIKGPACNELTGSSLGEAACWCALTAGFGQEGRRGLFKMGLGSELGACLPKDSQCGVEG